MTLLPMEWYGLRLCTAAQFSDNGDTFIDHDVANNTRHFYITAGGTEAHLTGLLTELGHNHPNQTAKELLA